MTRSEELDRMTEADKEIDILKQLEIWGSIRIDCKSAMGFWGGAIQRLEDAGRIQTRFVENYEDQYSYLKVTQTDAEAKL